MNDVEEKRDFHGVVEGPSLSRRRFLEIVAATALGSTSLRGRAAADATPLVWRGELLGAPSAITIHHDDRPTACAALQVVAEEIRMLEGVFSLFRADSALSRLNREGRVANAPDVLLDLLERCRALHDASAGAFDPTVQVLWTLYATHFAAPGASAAGPSEAAISSALADVNFSGVRRDGATLAFARAGMQLTLNGIAQGYATDRARAILVAHGLTHCLVNLGEYRALGRRANQRAWRIAISHPELPWRSLASVSLVGGQALSTSASAGTPFDEHGRYHHLFNPRTGLSANAWRSVSVVADNATLADGLSTALAVAPADNAADILARFPGTGALLLSRDERLIELGAPLQLDFS